jgi:hypothetical protein
MNMNLLELREIVDTLVELSEDHVSASKIQIKFKTFDPNFDENADKYQLPETITAVEFDILNWDKVTITIESPDEDKFGDPQKG